MRALAFLAFLLIPAVVTGQTSTAARLSLQAAAGPTVIGGGHALSAALGFSPVSRLDLLVNVERVHLPFELERLAGGYSTTRGGTLTFVSGELRVALMAVDRVSPFLLVGAGGGSSHPNVNAQFPDRITNDLRVLFVGGGVRVPLRQRFNLVGDVRGLLALENDDGVIAILPVRLGVAWRF